MHLQRMPRQQERKPEETRQGWDRLVYIASIATPDLFPDKALIAKKYLLKQ
jgi:hypothetical protein